MAGGTQRGEVGCVTLVHNIGLLTVVPQPQSIETPSNTCPRGDGLWYILLICNSPWSPWYKNCAAEEDLFVNTARTAFRIDKDPEVDATLMWYRARGRLTCEVGVYPPGNSAMTLVHHLANASQCNCNMTSVCKMNNYKLEGEGIHDHRPRGDATRSARDVHSALPNIATG